MQPLCSRGQRRSRAEQRYLSIIYNGICRIFALLSLWTKKQRTGNIPQFYPTQRSYPAKCWTYRCNDATTRNLHRFWKPSKQFLSFKRATEGKRVLPTYHGKHAPFLHQLNSEVGRRAYGLPWLLVDIIPALARRKFPTKKNHPPTMSTSHPAMNTNLQNPKSNTSPLRQHLKPSNTNLVPSMKMRYLLPILQT